MNYKNEIDKFGLEHFSQNLQRIDRFLEEKSKDGELVAIFDVGTKAARLIVAPKRVPSKASEWASKSFFNDGQVFNLGADFNLIRKKLDITKSNALEGIIFFLNIYKERLSKFNVKSDDITAVGTAVFRWMENRDEVIKTIHERTGIKIAVLSHEDEAFLSSVAINHTHTFGNYSEIPNRKYEDNEVILLIDQGGGSTEISFFNPSNRTMGKLDSINELGTVVLQENFFKLDEEKQIDPKMNRRRISTQFQRINRYIDEKINKWQGFPEINGKKIYAFGMGTAILKCFGSGSNYDQHNKLLSATAMQRTLDNYCEELEQSNQQVKTLYSKLVEEEETGRKYIVKKLVLLYGLPVYQKILKRFNLDELRYAAYGLRYGAYIAKYYFGYDLYDIAGGIKHSLLSDDKVSSGKNVNDCNLGTIFISYNQADSIIAQALKTKLEEHNLQITIDIDHMKFGDSIENFIKTSVHNNKFTICIVSKNSLRSPWVISEALEALMYEKTGGDKKLITIFVDHSLFNNEFYSEVIIEINKNINKLLELTQKVSVLGAGSENYDEQRERLQTMRGNMGKIMHKLQNTLSADFSNMTKFSENSTKLANFLIESYSKQ